MRLPFSWTGRRGAWPRADDITRWKRPWSWACRNTASTRRQASEGRHGLTGLQNSRPGSRITTAHAEHTQRPITRRVARYCVSDELDPPKNAAAATASTPRPIAGATRPLPPPAPPAHFTASVFSPDIRALSTSRPSQASTRSPSAAGFPAALGAATRPWRGAGYRLFHGSGRVAPPRRPPGEI